MSRQAVSAALATGALTIGLASTAAASTCVPVQGKILNNFAAADGSVTLGVVAMEFGRKGHAIKLKCALFGQSLGEPQPATINFIHSISCDDAVSAPAGDGSGAVPVHSSIVLHTRGYKLPPTDPVTQLFSFKEESVPYVGAPSRGLFFGVDPNTSKVVVEGVVYKAPYLNPDGSVAAGSIDMRFSGQFCRAG
jgi:hypothetical protein